MSPAATLKVETGADADQGKRLRTAGLDMPRWQRILTASTSLELLRHRTHDRSRERRGVRAWPPRLRGVVSIGLVSLYCRHNRRFSRPDDLQPNYLLEASEYYRRAERWHHP